MAFLLPANRSLVDVSQAMENENLVKAMITGRRKNPADDTGQGIEKD
jgi:cytochrome b